MPGVVRSCGSIEVVGGPVTSRRSSVRRPPGFSATKRVATARPAPYRHRTRWPRRPLGRPRSRRRSARRPTPANASCTGRRAWRRARAATGPRAGRWSRASRAAAASAARPRCSRRSPAGRLGQVVAELAAAAVVEEDADGRAESSSRAGSDPSSTVPATSACSAGSALQNSSRRSPAARPSAGNAVRSSTRARVSASNDGSRGAGEVGVLLGGSESGVHIGQQQAYGVVGGQRGARGHRTGPVARSRYDSATGSVAITPSTATAGPAPVHLPGQRGGGREVRA